MRPDGFERRYPVVGFRHHLDRPARRQRTDHAVAKQRVVIAHHHAHLFACHGSTPARSGPRPSLAAILTRSRLRWSSSQRRTASARSSSDCGTRDSSVSPCDRRTYNGSSALHPLITATEALAHQELGEGLPTLGHSMRIGVVFPQTELGGDASAVRTYGQRVEELGFSHLLA